MDRKDLIISLFIQGEPKVAEKHVSISLRVHLVMRTVASSSVQANQTYVTIVFIYSDFSSISPLPFCSSSDLWVYKRGEERKEVSWCR